MALLAALKQGDVSTTAKLASTLERIADHPVNRGGELLPWNINISALQAAASSNRRVSDRTVTADLDNPLERALARFRTAIDKRLLLNGSAGQAGAL